MLHLMQNRLKEEEQHLLKSGSKWDFFTACISRKIEVLVTLSIHLQA